MKKLQVLWVMALLISITTLVSGCQLVGDIFKAGMGVGIFMVVAVIGIVIFIIAKVAGGGNK